MYIFEAIATDSANVICRAANAANNGETFTTAIAALISLGQEAYVITDGGFSVHTVKTLCEAWDYELDNVQDVLKSEEAWPIHGTHTSTLTHALEWFSAQYR